MKYLRKTIFSIAFLVMPFVGYGQLLWYNWGDDADKTVTIEQGIERMLDNYDLYDGYTPHMGYTHKVWLDDIDDKSLRQEWKDRFDALAYDEVEFYAHRSREEREGGGTVLIVRITYIDREYIHRVVFTNSYAIETTYPSERDKFERWFRTFIN